MSNILLTLGDSWPEGAELGNGRRYGEILRDIMGFDQFYTMDLVVPAMRTCCINCKSILKFTTFNTQ